MLIGCSSRTPGATASSLSAISSRLGASHRYHRNPTIPFPHHCGKRPGNGRIELHSRPALDVIARPLRLPGLTVGPIGSQRVIDVADMYQPAGVLSASGIVQRGIASTVEHDVMFVRQD